MDELAVDAPRHPSPGIKLADVGVPGKLEGESGLLGYFGAIGGVRQEDAGAVAVQSNAFEDGTEMRAVGGVAIRHADELQSVDVDFFVAEHANARL